MNCIVLFIDCTKNTKSYVIQKENDIIYNITYGCLSLKLLEDISIEENGFCSSL